MRTERILLTIVPVILLGLLASCLWTKTCPLGVPGEWEWLRLTRGPDTVSVALAAFAVLVYAGFSALLMRFLVARPGASMSREGFALGVLAIAAAAVQLVVPMGAPPGYDLARWALVLHAPASTGYYTVARREIHDSRTFLAAYPEWIRRQDALHVGTHPPGLFLVEHALLATFASHPDCARLVVDHLPPPVTEGFRVINAYDRLPLADRAALGTTAALTWILCAATVVPLYVLARASLPVPLAWTAAVFWPLVPAALMFQPDADTGFPFLSTTALALAAHAGRTSRGRGRFLAAAAGLVLAAGMMLTLVFLAVGLLVGCLLASARGHDLRARIGLVLATGIGFLIPLFAFWGVTGANPFLIWWWNQHNHARFYQEFPRTYRAWIVVNPIELAVALGLPASFWGIWGLFRVRQVPSVAWWTLGLLVVLTVTGRNLSEVARLWLPFMPPLLTLTSVGLSRTGAGPGPLAVAVAVATQGAAVLLLQSAIQVVYPV